MIQTKPLSPGDKDTTPLQVITNVGEVFQDLVDQLNREKKIYYGPQGQAPDGLNEGDILLQRNSSTGIVTLSVKNSGKGFTAITIPAVTTLATTVTALAATVAAHAALTKTANAVLDFPNTLAQTSSDLTIAVTGALTTGAVALGVPNGSVNANSSFTAWVSSASIVTVRFNNYSALAINPASGTFHVTVINP